MCVALWHSRTFITHSSSGKRINGKNSPSSASYFYSLLIWRETSEKKTRLKNFWADISWWRKHYRHGNVFEAFSKCIHHCGYQYETIVICIFRCWPCTRTLILSDCFPRLNHIFQYDYVTTHTFEIEAWEEHGEYGTRLPWSPKAPELNPIMHLCCYLVSVICSTDRPLLTLQN